MMKISWLTYTSITLNFQNFSPKFLFTLRLFYCYSLIIFGARNELIRPLNSGEASAIALMHLLFSKTLVKLIPCNFYLCFY